MFMSCSFKINKLLITIPTLLFIALVNIALGSSVDDRIAAVIEQSPGTNEEHAYESLYVCPLEKNNQMEVVLKKHPPTKDNVIIDIGSGNGRCSRYLSALGYTVYSVDSWENSILAQKISFCDFDIKSILKHLAWIQDEQSYNDYCKKFVRDRVHFIEDDFSKKNVIDFITQKHPKWNVVIALDSFQFFSDAQRDAALEAINTNLVSGGILIVSALPKSYYGLNANKIFSGVYDFNIEDMITRNDIKNKYTVYSKISNKDYNTNYTREKWHPQFLRSVTLTRK